MFFSSSASTHATDGRTTVCPCPGASLGPTKAAGSQKQQHRRACGLFLRRAPPLSHTDLMYDSAPSLPRGENQLPRPPIAPVVPAAQSLYFARSVGDTPLVSDHVLLFYLVRLLYHQEICPHGAPAQYLDRGAPWSRTSKPPKRCGGGAGSTWKCRHLTGTPRASPVAMWGEPRPGCL